MNTNVGYKVMRSIEMTSSWSLHSSVEKIAVLSILLSGLSSRAVPTAAAAASITLSSSLSLLYSSLLLTLNTIVLVPYARCLSASSLLYGVSDVNDLHDIVGVKKVSNLVEGRKEIEMKDTAQPASWIGEDDRHADILRVIGVH